MKNFHQNLLMTLALALCALCAYQWVGETAQRNRIETLNRTIYEKSAAIQGLTNSVKTMDRQLGEMDVRITELKLTIKTNDQMLVAQKREIARFAATGETLTNEIIQYKAGLTGLEAKLKEAYDGIKKQNEAMKELAGQRDDFIQKFNQSIKDRNEIVNKYNDLVEKVEKAQTATGK